MKNKNRVALIICTLLITITACSKKESTNPAEPKQLSVAELIKEQLLDSQVYDYTILLSTVHPVSVLEENSISKSQTGVQAYTKDFVEAGALDVNTINIDFKDKTYFLQTNDVLTAANFTGRECISNFKSANPALVPDFSLTNYSPIIAEIQYDDLVENKIDRSNGFTINWERDAKYGNRQGLLVVEGVADTEDASREMLSTKFFEYDGNIHLSADHLRKFEKCNSIRIYFARGYNEIYEIDGRKIEFQLINYSWSRIFFK